MAKGNPNPPNPFQGDNQKAVRHGGEGALKRLQKDQPFIGLALEVLDGVLAEMGVNLGELSGIEGILVKRAARFEAVARMFDHASDSAACDGDLVAWERYQQRAGWIGSKAFSALKEVAELLGNRPCIVDYEELLSEGQDD